MEQPDFRSPEFLRAHIAQTMAFYHPRCIDPAGGFFHCFKDDGSVHDASHRHLLGSTRLVCNYAMASREFGNEAYREAMLHGLHYVRHAHLDTETGGYAWTMRDGVPEDRANHGHGLACVLLAYSHALMAGVGDARDWMEEVRILLEARFWEAEHGLYKNDADADWHFSDYRGQHANMHLCEAMLAAYEASGEPHWLDRALLLASNMTRRQAAKAGGLVWEHYDRYWNVDWNCHLDHPKDPLRPWGFQAGHQTAWARLLLILDRHVATDWLAPMARHLFDNAMARSWDTERCGMYRGFAPESRRQPGMDGAPIAGDWFTCDDDKHAWVQAESLAAAALLAARFDDPEYWDWYERLWAYAWAHMVDHEHGGWYRILDADNRKLGDGKGPAGTTDYHSISAAYEVMNLLKPAQ